MSRSSPSDCSPLALRSIVYALRIDSWGARYKPDSAAVLRLLSLGLVRASRYGRLRLTCSRDAALRALNEANSKLTNERA